MELFRTKTKANNLIAKAESLEYYKKQMDDLLTENKFLNINHFNFQHKKHRNEAISMFASKKIEGDGSFWRCKQDLYETIKNMYPLYKQRNEDNKKFSEETDEKDCIKMLNEVKEVYSKGMEDKLYGRKYINHDFDQLHSELFREAKLKYSTYKEGSQYFKIYNDKLDKEIMEKFQSYKRQNTDFERSKNLEQEKNKLLFMISAQEYYRNQLEIYFNEHSFFIGESEVKKKHEQIKREALGQYQTKCLQNGVDFLAHLHTLSSQIDNTYTLFLRARKEKSLCTVM
uniref:Uncharacterized protein n=1 Tax=Megaselia scalaris TaxID=36166 RepID=T1GET8_MEGSC